MALRNAYAIDMPAPDTLLGAVSALQASMGQYRHYRAVRAQHD